MKVDAGLLEAVKLIDDLDYIQRTRRLENYKPYPYQLDFHNAVGKGTGRPASQRMLIAANGIGKTWCGGYEAAMHATGIYPEWYRGTRFVYPVEILCAGITNESTRDIIQKALFGDPTDDKQLGTGTIPKRCIGKKKPKTGIPNALDNVQVKHVSGGWSKVYLRAYEQGPRKFMGIRFDVGWVDEEPPQDIWSQFLRATTGRKNAILFGTLTPEEGMTEVVTQFLENLQIGQAVVNATWDDAPHLSVDEKEQRLAAYPAHEREMRSKGTPLMGAGLVFAVPDEKILVDPIEIPRHWPRINGMDFGYDHPFAAASLAYDRDADVVYLVAEYRESRQLPPIHAAAIRPWGEWIPCAWPHDGLNTEKGTGDELIKSYRDARLNLLPWKATNPPGPGMKEGEGGNSVEAPILEMLERMETGRWKVFKTCTQWMQEKRMYHRDKMGRLVKQMDDLISASRYAYMMLRHARTVSVLPRVSVPKRVGGRNW